MSALSPSAGPPCDLRPVLVRRVGRAYLQHILAPGPATIDPVRNQVPIPDGIDPRLVGVAVLGLVRDGIICRVGRDRSPRPPAHSRWNDIWRIADHAAALAWLAAHPDPGADTSPRQLTFGF